MMKTERAVASMESKPYDTKEGIEEYLGDGLRGLNRLKEDRRDATYGQSPNPCNLRSWVVLGRYVLDACGNLSGITEGAPADVFRFMPGRGHGEHTWPSVVDLDEALRRVSPISYSSQMTVPRHDKVCTYCGHGWEIHNCHDSVREDDDAVVDFGDYVGKTAREMKALLPHSRTHVMRWHSDGGIRNDKLVDLSPDPKYSSLKVNELGWMSGRVPDDYVIQPGDQGLVHKFGWAHKRCYELRKINDYTKRFTKIFADAGYKGVDLSIVPNRYCRCARCGPWFMAKTAFGDVEVGWRKSVILVDWSRATLRAIPDFSKEEVTQGESFVHAWGYERATAYLRVLRFAAAGESILPLPPPADAAS